MTAHRRTNRRNGRNGIVYPRVAKLGSEERVFAVRKGTTIQELLDLAEIDGGSEQVKINNRTIDDFDTPITSSVRIVAIPNVKGGNEESEEDTSSCCDFDEDETTEE